MAKENEEILHTLADMNQAIGAGFDRVDGRVIEIGQRIDRMESNVTNQFADVNRRLDRIENILLEDLQRRVEVLEQKVSR